MTAGTLGFLPMELWLWCINGNFMVDFTLSNIIFNVLTMGCLDFCLGHDQNFDNLTRVIWKFWP